MSAATLFDQVRQHLGLKNDAALSKRMETHRVSISNMRAGRIPISAPLMVRIHEETGWPTRQIKALIGDDAAQEGGGE
ncbi:hypothetical protein Herbaro_09330 [Herbaspirillum sp. WKF16]|uniref:hypothetical protein n=1 Tax=Herbaspirillum sp. WKF16 TaxID=3028312 RepID=UPI0023A9729C|nr:hypothetical protein [Herbaspirillum sp. WKF16]WDZ97962.1 hypothetical protein Herbaro_09330 [Herbaspirillum sp. WKF16]